jgi:hypothetical protein
MRRALSLALIIGALAVLASPPARAQDQRIGAFFNLGFMTKESVSPNWLTLGAELVIPLSAWCSLNPEVTLWGANFRFTSYYIVPGVMVTFRVGRFTLGAGPVQRFFFSRYSDGGSSEKVAPKIQLAYRSRNSRLAFIAIPIASREYVSVGLALGMGF